MRAHKDDPETYLCYQKHQLMLPKAINYGESWFTVRDNKLLLRTSIYTLVGRVRVSKDAHVREVTIKWAHCAMRHAKRACNAPGGAATSDLLLKWDYHF